MYKEIRDTLQVGDVIAFSGKGRVSEIIKWKTRSEVSHVGMVYALTANGKDCVQIIESTTLGNLPDIKEGKARKGVQLQFLPERLDTYDGKVWVYRMHNVINEKDEKLMLEWLEKTHEEEVEYDSFQAIGAGMDFFDKIIPGIEMEPDFSSLFCSELVAEALKIAGVIDPSINPSEQTPADVCGYPCFNEPIRLK